MPVDILTPVCGERIEGAVVGLVDSLDDGASLCVECGTIGYIAPRTSPASLYVGKEAGEEILVGDLEVGIGIVAIVESSSVA